MLSTKSVITTCTFYIMPYNLILEILFTEYFV